MSSAFWRLLRNLLPVVCVFMPIAAQAQMTSASVHMTARIVSLLTPTPTSPVTAAIIYKPGDAASEAEAALIERALATMPSDGFVVLKPKRVAVSALHGLAGAKVAFVTQGLSADFADIAEAAAKRSIVTISSDQSCAKAGHCVVAITSKPRVGIFVSRKARDAAKLKFGSAFLMLVKEV